MTDPIASCPFPHEWVKTFVCKYHSVFRVTCEVCGATGPGRDTEAEAVAAWNRTARLVEAARDSKSELAARLERHLEIFGSSNPHFKHPFDALLRAVEAWEQGRGSDE